MIKSQTSLASEDKAIAEQMELEDRITITAKKPAFITIKDHKANYMTNPTYHLINPTKPERGRVSKQLLDRVNSAVNRKLALNQLKSTSAVLHWFNNLTTTNRHSFIVFDIVEFYPSISSKLLSDALDFANLHTTVSNHKRNIILHTKKSILVHDNSFWGKRQSDNLFDITMGSHDVVETCGLVGLFLSRTISKKYKANIGLYRDDGLGVTDLKPQLAERLEKDLCTLFQSHGLKITIDVNIKTTDYLDVTLDLVKKHHTPYSKPNNIPLYVHKKSNHPPSILKNIPESINCILCDISTNETIFNNAIPQYQDALAKSGYNYQLKYRDYSNNTNTSIKPIRQRRVIWYNPPYSRNIKTKISSKFLKLIKDIFHSKHPLHKYLTLTLKLSYSCCPNLEQTITAHNKSVTK